MRLLFVHPAFPSQFCHLAPHLAAAPGNEVLGVGEKANLLGFRNNAAAEAAPFRLDLPAVRLLGYDLPAAEPAGRSRVDANLRRAVERGLAVAAGARELRRTGFRPDVVVAHPGWGDALFLREVFPEARILLYCEAFYRASGADVGFDPEFPVDEDTRLRYRVTNAPWLISLDAADWGVAPTRWQRQLFPREYAARISVIHDGIDTDAVAPDPDAEFRLRDGRRLRHGDEVITFVARNLEPHRGFHVFMRALPELQRRRPRAQVVIAGGDGTSYSPAPADGSSYRERLLREVGGRLDLSRLHFCGWLPYAEYLSLLRVSAAHVYLTYPSVLSWSMLEAMAAGCLVIGSRTGPVEEVIDDGANGLLVDFFSPGQLAAVVAQALEQPAAARALREEARRFVAARFDLRRVCLPAQARLVAELASGKLPGAQAI